MERNFARSLALVLKSEGGWSDNKADPGGATMKGVTLVNFRRYVKADATKADLRAITDDQIATVYRKFYWDAVSGDQLPDGVDYATFDFAVNSGPARAAKYLQASCGIAQDGVVGPATVAAARANPAGVIIDRLCDVRLVFMKGARDHNGNLLWPTFGKGWANRVASVRKDALLMTAPQPISAPAAPASQPTPQASPPASVPAVEDPSPPERLPAAPVPAAADPAATIGIIGALVIAASFYWHEFTAWLSSIF